METAAKFSALVGGIAMLLLAGCDNSPGVTPSPAPSGTTSSIDPMALIEGANETVEAGTVSLDDLQPEDIIPADILENPDPETQIALATLEPTTGSEVGGMVAFIQQPAEPVEEESETIGGIDIVPGADEETQTFAPLRIVGTISGLAPGPHGFHIHAVGDCSAGDASSAGAHLNPGETEHGGPGSPDSHLGDLGNITADAYGLSKLDMRDPYVSFSGSNSVLNRAVIVHANRDNESTQPDGNSGAAVTCGVIQQVELGSL